MTSRIRGGARCQRHARAEEGFTLIEVLVSMVLLGVVLLAGAVFMIRSVYASSATGTRQAAVTVANQVLEQVRAISPTFDSTHKSPLVYGRIQADVAAQWAAAATSGLDVTGTYTGSGSTSFDADTYQTTGTQTVPLVQTRTLGNQVYTVNTLIGTCVQPNTASACTKATAGTELLRIVVQVTWVPGKGRTCSGGTCSFSSTTLIDPTKDPIFNVNRKPVATNDPDAGVTFSVASGASTSVGVIANDSGDFAVNGAITVLAAPAHGTAAATATGNLVTYTSTSGYSGTDTFTYTVTDTGGRTSNAATVTVTTTPVGVNDTATIAPGAAALAIPVLTNDLGTTLSLVSLTTPTLGSAVISAGKINYTPPASATGTATLTYTAKDGIGQQYTASLAVTIKPNPPVAASLTVCRPAVGYNGSLMSLVTGTNLSASGLALNTTSSGTNPGLNGWGISTPSSTGVVSITRASTNTGTFTYTITDPLGQISNVATITLKGSGC
jgi:prepilin-type N-terminal cleavage/methylation domain-containing protein